MSESERIVPVPAEFASKSRIGSMEKYKAMYERSIKDPDAFWAEQAERLERKQRWKNVSKFDFNKAEIAWFLGGKLNVSANCLDRHLTGPRKDKTAILWEGDDPKDARKLTYAELHAEVCKFANALKGLGVKKGDR